MTSAHLAGVPWQFSRYVIVGAVAFAIDATLLLALAASGMHPVAANTIAFLVANAINIVAAHHFVFGSSARTSDWRVLYVLILTISVVGLAINDLLLFAAIALLGLPLLGAKVFATLMTLVWNFWARKRLAYK
jgi:putative flippase GtrA